MVERFFKSWVNQDIMDEVTEKVRRTEKRYQIRYAKMAIICYCDDVILTAETENQLQRLLK